MDLDDLLSLEEQYYQDGYEYGKSEILKETYISGKMLGIQTGYQKLVQLGMVFAYLETLLENSEKKCDDLTEEKCNGNKNAKKVKGKLNKEDFKVIETEALNNEEDSIEKLEKLTKKCKNWMLMNSSLLPTDRNSVLAKIVGELPKNANDLENW